MKFELFKELCAELFGEFVELNDDNFYYRNDYFDYFNYRFNNSLVFELIIKTTMNCISDHVFAFYTFPTNIDGLLSMSTYSVDHSSAKITHWVDFHHPNSFNDCREFLKRRFSKTVK